MKLSKERQFWEWFKKNESKFFYLDDIKNENERERLLDEFLNHLHKYCDKLYFQIGSDIKSNEKEVIISAEGNVEYFDKVEKLVSASPNLGDWVVRAFKPPMGIDFVINYEDLKIDVRKLWFLPLENENLSESLGLRICIENYDTLNEKKYLSAVYQILDTVLGEKSNSLDVNYVEVDKIPPKPENEGLMEIGDLQEYIKWRKSKIRKSVKKR